MSHNFHPPKEPEFAFAHINLPVSDSARSSTFFCSHFGFRRGPSFTDAEGRETGVFLYLNRGMFIELIATSQVERWQGHICLVVEDIAQTVARLRGAGLVVRDISLGRSLGWMAFLKDPDGHALELNEYSHPRSWIANCLRENDPTWWAAHGTSRTIEAMP